MRNLFESMDTIGFLQSVLLRSKNVRPRALIATVLKHARKTARKRVQTAMLQAEILVHLSVFAAVQNQTEEVLEPMEAFAKNAKK